MDPIVLNNHLSLARKKKIFFPPKGLDSWDTHQQVQAYYIVVFWE